ncbi:MAG: PAS domain S-box protein, partial [Armatimonadetes bacterium]|nr:PAS domain S-box protein [Armatimonadota bacterium]
MLLEQARLRDERRRMVEDLVASERRFRAVFTDSPVGLVVLDSDKRVLSSNPAFCSMLGVEEAEVVGLPLADLMLAPDRGAPQDGPPNADTGLPERARFEARMQASGGSTVKTHVTVSPLKNREDGDHHQLAIIEDVTERVRSEEAERGRDAILRAVGRGAEMFLGGEDWDAAADGFLGLLGESADLRDVAVIRGCAAGEARVLHRCLSQREAAGTSQREAAATRCASQRRDSGDGQGHPREAGEVIQAVVALGERLMAGLTVTGAFASAPGESAAGAVAVPIFVRQACWGCMVIEASAASREWHQVELDALRTAADLFGDAVQDRDAAQELRTGEERTRLIVDTALDAVISVAGDGTISGWNAQARDTFGWEAQEAAGKDVVNFVAPPSARAEWTAQGVGATWSWDQPPRSRFETVAVRKDGSIFPAEVAASGTRLNDAVMMGVFVRDLTTQKAAQAELEEARRQDESVAARIQRAMLVGDPPIETPRLGIASETRPGQVIAGDFVANLRHDENTIDVVVGDVMGKGSNAALLGAITKGHIYQATRHLALRLLEFGRLPEPHEVVAAVHEQITRDLAELESFVTLLYARLDLRAMRCTLVDCGHTRTVHYSRRTGECTFIKGDNLPLGVADREF